MTLKISDEEADRILQADKAFAQEFNKDRGEVLRNLAMKADPLRDLTDEEEAAIQAGIALDPDNPEMTQEQIAEARPFREAHPDLSASIDRTRGHPTVIIGPEDAVAFGWTPEEIARCEEANGKNWRARVPIDGARLAPVTPEESRSPGRPRVASPRQPVTLRLSPETIARYKAEGGTEWRARMIETLEKAGG